MNPENGNATPNYEYETLPTAETHQVPMDTRTHAMLRAIDQTVLSRGSIKGSTIGGAYISGRTAPDHVTADGLTMTMLRISDVEESQSRYDDITQLENTDGLGTLIHSAEREDLLLLVNRPGDTPTDVWLMSKHVGLQAQMTSYRKLAPGEDATLPCAFSDMVKDFALAKAKIEQDQTARQGFLSRLGKTASRHLKPRK